LSTNRRESDTSKLLDLIVQRPRVCGIQHGPPERFYAQSSGLCSSFDAFELRGLHPKLLAWFANECAKGWFEKHGRQTTNLASISLSMIKQLPVPIPPAAEQKRLLDLVIDEVSVDLLLDAHGVVDTGRARSLVESWAQYLADHRDEITAVQLMTEARERRAEALTERTAIEQAVHDYGSVGYLADLYTVLGEIHAALGDTAEARHHFGQAIDYYTAAGPGADKGKTTVLGLRDALDSDLEHPNA
jgi:hypothetical protein